MRLLATPLLHAFRGRDRDLVRPWKTGQSCVADIPVGILVPASGDATLTRKTRRLNPKMLTPALRYINSRAKLGRS